MPFASPIRRSLLFSVLAAFIAIAANTPHASAAAPYHERQWPELDRYLSTGQLAEGEEALAKRLEAEPDDAQTRYSLGIIQFLRSVETLVQSLHHHGLRPDPTMQLPLLRLPTPHNDDPASISYDDFRAILQRFTDDLTKAEATLARVDDPNVKVPVRFGLIRMDLNGDGVVDDHEMFWRIYLALSRPPWEQREADLDDDIPEETRAFVIAFDQGDVHWMRGYCHLLMAFTEFYLAHDSREMFDRTAQIFFPKVQSPFPDLTGNEGEITHRIADAIAMIHLMNWRVIEPPRMQHALSHLQAMIAQSRASWKAILAETDDDREWLPSPKQTGVLPDVNVTQEMIDGWHAFLDEADAILAGRTLLPHWRFPGKGFNLHRVFTDPRRFDLVLWVQGSAAVPYIEDGRVTDPDFWMRLNRQFQGQFIGFAIWFN